MPVGLEAQPASGHELVVIECLVSRHLTIIAWSSPLGLLKGMVTTRMKRRPVRLWIGATRLGLVFGGFLAPLLALEVIVRIFGPVLPGDYNVHGFKDPHPVYGLYPRAFARTWNKTDEFAAYIRLNSRGLRGAEIQVPKPPDTLRVLVLGDSLMFAAQLPDEQTFSVLLQTRLQSLFGPRTVEVINAGVEGWGTGHEYAFWEYEGRALEPDLVILAFFVGNDIEDNTYETDSHKNQAGRVYYTLDASDRLQRLPVTMPEQPTTRAALNALRAHSELVNLVEVWPHHLRDLWKGDRSGEPARRGLGVFRREPSPTIQRSWIVTEALLRELQRSVTATGAGFMVMAVPSPAQVHPDAREIWDLRGKDDERFLDWKLPSQRLSGIAARQRLTMLDLRETFVRAAKQSAVRLYFPVDQHWTAAGHERAAAAASAYLAGQALLPGQAFEDTASDMPPMREP
jgi:hypothetical protein